MKKILILGAGLMQKPAIEAAKKLGYKAYVVDANPKAVAVKFADVFEPVDLKDREGLLSYAKKINGEGEGLAAVFTAGTDFSASVAYIAENLSLKGHSFDSCLNASDKVRMRGCFEKSGVPSPAFREVSEKDDIPSIIESMTFPKVIKPCDNMGARGCRLIRNKEEAESSIKAAIAYSRTHRAILEDYMDGPEFSIDSIVCDGNLTITGFADRHIYYPPYFIEIGHTMPSKFDEKIKNELIATFALGIKALGLTHGVAKADIKYTKNGPMIGEIAARLSGGYMSGWTYPMASDFPLTEEALKISLDGESEVLKSSRVPVKYTPHESVAKYDQPFKIFEVPCKRFCAERAWMSIDGVAASQKWKTNGDWISVDKNLFPKEHELLILPRSFEGSKVNFPRNNVEKCGNVIALGSTFDEAEKNAFDVVKNIVIELKKGNTETENYLAGITNPDEKGFPPSAYSEISSGETDFNHRTISETVQLFEEITGKKLDLKDEKTAAVLKKGGLQGLLHKFA